MKKAIAVLSWVCVMASLGSAAAQTALVHSSDAEALCKLSAPATGLPLGEAAYLEARNRRLTDLYHVSIPAGQLALQRYDPVTQMGTAVGPADIQLDAGVHVTVDTATFQFIATPEEWEGLQGDLEAGGLSLRLSVVLPALFDPDQPLCTVAAGQLPRVRTLAVAAELVSVGRPNSRVPRTQTPRAKGVEAFWGPGLVPIPPTVTLVSPSNADGFSAPLQQRLLICFIRGLAKGGPSSAALVLETTFDAAGQASAVVPVDATGFPALIDCAENAVLGIPGPAVLRGKTVRVTAFFAACGASASCLR